jgi:hypothetical protein
MSTINTNSIDANYPIPGQNNSTQGFRNNFATIKNNLGIAGSEITDLQNNAVLKAPLANTSLNNDMANALISNASVLGFRSTTYNLGNALTNLVTVDLSLGDVQYGNLSGNVLLQFGNWAPTQTQSNVTLQIGRPNAQADFSITFPAEAVFENNYGWTLTENSSNPNGAVTLSFPYDVTQLNLLVSSVDCGNTLYVQPINRPMQTAQVQKRTPPTTGQLGDVIGTVCVSDLTASTLDITTSTATDYLVTTSTTALYPGIPVVFTGNSFEPNIVSGATYYVSNVANATHFKISSDFQAASNINLVGGTGNFTLNPVSYMFVAVDNYSGNSFDKNVISTTSPNVIGVDPASGMTHIAVNYPIIFTGAGTANANVTAGEVYYVKSVSGTSITISKTIDNGIAGPTYEGVLTHIPDSSYPLDFTVYEGKNIFRQIPLIPGTETTTSAVIPNIADIRIGGGVNGYFLVTDGTGNLAWSAGGGSGSGLVAGSNTQVQFNNAGTFGAAAGFTYNNVTNVLSVPGNIVSGGTLQGSNINATANLSVTGTANLLGNVNIGGNTLVGNLTSGTQIVSNGNVIANAIYALSLVSSANAGIFGNVIAGTANIAGAVNCVDVIANGNSIFGNIEVSGQVAVTGNIFSNANILANGFYVSGVTTGIVATGSTQADAANLLASINIVQTVTSGSGVKLPAAQAGLRIIVRNINATNALKVYPNTGARIDLLAVNTAYSLPINTNIELYCAVGGATGQWYIL